MGEGANPFGVVSKTCARRLCVCSGFLVMRVMRDGENRMHSSLSSTAAHRHALNTPQNLSPARVCHVRVCNRKRAEAGGSHCLCVCVSVCVQAHLCGMWACAAGPRAARSTAARASGSSPPRPQSGRPPRPSRWTTTGMCSPEFP